MSSIKVAVRCRPLFENEKPATGLDIQSRRILMDSKTYDPDYTFTPSCTQDDVLAVARPILQCVKDGLNGTIMVYGQTGTGKTYTMLGQDGADNGLVHKVIAEMLDHLQAKTRDGVKCALTLSIIEIYNEKLTDMLSANGEEEVTLINGFPRSTCKTTLCRVSDANEAISSGLRWRHTAATLMNDRSSRSHVVFIVDFEQYNEYTEQMDVAHLFLVDLAGSESLKKSQASGATAAEAGKINKSLLALKSVFLALSNTSEATRPTHVPYRDSKLTELLQDSIGGTARTLMIACISSVGRDIEETKSTLHYAVKARSIRNAANTEKEKLLVRLRSLETENQKIRNRLQERVSERGGYYVTREEHEATQRTEEEVVELRESVAQLMHDRQTSEAHQHISESQQKILLVMIEEKEEKLRQFHGVYREALHRFEHQANTLQRIVQASVRQSKTALQSASEDTAAKLSEWKRQMLTIVDSAAAFEPVSARPVSDGKPDEEEAHGNEEKGEEEQGIDGGSERVAGSPALPSMAAPFFPAANAASLPPLPFANAAVSGSSRRSSPAPVHARGALGSHPVSQRGSVVTTAATAAATAPSSQAGSPTRGTASPATNRSGQTLKRGLSASRVPQSLFGAVNSSGNAYGSSTRPSASTPQPVVASCAPNDEIAVTSSLPCSSASGEVVNPCFLSGLDDECRRIAQRLNASFRELAEACVAAAQRHVDAVQAINAQRQARAQQSLDQLRKAFDEHATSLDKAERCTTQDLTSAQECFVAEARTYTQYPEPLAASTLQQLTREATLATVRTAEMAFPSAQPSPAVQAALDALVRTYQQKMRETTISALMPLSANALTDVDVRPATGVMPCGPEEEEEVQASEPDAMRDGSPNGHKDSTRSTQSQRGSSVPSSSSTTGVPENASPRTAPARRGFVRERRASAAPVPASVREGAASAVRKPSLPLAATVRRDASKSRPRDGSINCLQSLPGNVNVPRSHLSGEKRSRSSLSKSTGSLSGRQLGAVESKKRRSVSGTDNQK